MVTVSIIIGRLAGQGKLARHRVAQYNAGPYIFGSNRVEPDFWHQRWENGLIGFHLDQVNPFLIKYWPELGISAGQRVLVPLCGKSVDLRWLAAQGHEVIGVELSPIAVKAFFAEQHLKARRREGERFGIWQADNITVLCGNVFDLTAEDIGRIDAVYDRAALVALPVDMRRSYVTLLNNLIPARVPHLLVSLDYDQDRMDGPPFAVSDAEIHTLYGDRYLIRQAHNEDVLASNDKFRERGLTYLNESVYLLQQAD